MEVYRDALIDEIEHWYKYDIIDRSRRTEKNSAESIKFIIIYLKLKRSTHKLSIDLWIAKHRQGIMNIILHLAYQVKALFHQVINKQLLCFIIDKNLLRLIIDKKHAHIIVNRNYFA